MNLLSFSFSLTDKTLTYLISSTEDVLKTGIVCPCREPPGWGTCCWMIYSRLHHFSYASIALFKEVLATNLTKKII